MKRNDNGEISSQTIESSDNGPMGFLSIGRNGLCEKLYKQLHPKHDKKDHYQVSGD